MSDELEKVDKLSIAKNNYIKEMEDVATSHDGVTDDDFAHLTSDATSKQLKVFLLSLARNELLRVIRLTDTLNEIEQKFIQEALDNKEDMNMGVLAEIMKSVVTSLNRSTDLIHKVMNDESIKLIVDNSTNIFNAPGSQNVILDNPASREKVKNLARDLLKHIEKGSSE